MDQKLKINNVMAMVIIKKRFEEIAHKQFDFIKNNPILMVDKDACVELMTNFFISEFFSDESIVTIGEKTIKMKDLTASLSSEEFKNALHSAIIGLLKEIFEEGR